MTNDKQDHDNNEDSQNLDKTRMVMLPHAWGVSNESHDEQTALRRALCNWHDYGINDDGKVKMWTAVLHGEWHLNSMGGVHAEDITQEEEIMVDAEMLQKIRKLDGDLEIIMESAICGDTIEDLEDSYLEEIDV